MTENLAVSSPGKPPLSMPVIRQILFARLDLRKGPVAGLPLLAELPKQIPSRIRQQKTPRSDLLPRATPTSFTTVRPRRPTTLVVGGIGQFRFVDSYLYS